MLSESDFSMTVELMRWGGRGGSSQSYQVETDQLRTVKMCLSAENKRTKGREFGDINNRLE